MADATPASAAPSLGHYLRPLRRQRRTMIVIVLIGVILGGLAAAHVRATYTASSKVVVQTDATDGVTVSSTGRSATALGPNMDTESQVITSATVAERVAAILKTDASPKTLLSHVTITVPANTTILRIAFKAHSLPQAVAGANAFAQAYLANRTAVSQGILNKEIAQAQANEATARAGLIAATKKLDSLQSGSAAKHAELITLNTYQAQVTQYTNALGTLKDTTLTPGQLFASASASGSSPNQGRAIALLAGIVLGLLAAIAAAFYREWRVKTLRCEDDLERFGVRLIAEISPSGRGDRNGTKAATARSRAEQRLASAVGGCLQRSGGTAYVAALSPAASSGAVADRLAAELSRFGDTAEVITHDPNAVTLVQPLTVAPAVDDAGAEDQVGKTAADVEDDVREDAALGWPSLDVSRSVPAKIPAPRPNGVAKTTNPAGAADLQPVESVMLSAEAGMLQQVAAARQRSQYVVLDGPDPLVNSEGYFLATLGDVTVLVIDAGVTTKVQLSEALDQIQVTGTTLLGALLWRPVPVRRGEKAAMPAVPTVRTTIPQTRATSLDVLPHEQITEDDSDANSQAKGRAKALRGSADSAT